MPTLEDHIIIKRSKELLFDLSQDYSKRLQWDRYLKKAYLIDATNPAVSVKAYCESSKGIGMTVAYLTYNRPNQVAMEMVKGPFLFKKFSGSWRFIDLTPDTTKVLFRYHYQTYFPFLLHPFIKWLLKTDLKKRLSSFKLYADKHL